MTTRARHDRARAMLVVGAAVLPACRHTERASPSSAVPPAPAPRAPTVPPPIATITVRSDAAASSPTSTDAGVGLIDLLHASAAEVRVSSRVANQTDIPQNLVDGRLETAWSSRTGQLDGAEIDVRIPAEATVDHFALTVGMTRSGREGDLFPMNPRISEVRVFREYESLGRFPLDPTRPDMQNIPIHRPGGIYRIVVTRHADGSRSDWREVTVTELEARGTIATPQPNVPRVALGRILPATMPPAYSLPTGALEAQCHAFSLADHAALCVVGWHGSGLGEDAEHPEWVARFVGGDGIEDVNLFEPPDGSEWMNPTELPIPARAQTALRARLASGNYVALEPLREMMDPGIPVEWAMGAGLRWMRRRTSRGGDNSAERFTDRLEVRWGAREAWTAIETYEDQPVYDPDVDVYLVPGGRYAIVSTRREHGDEGVSGEIAAAWLCDAQTRTCE